LNIKICFAGAKALHAKGTIVFAIAVEDGQPINMRELEVELDEITFKNLELKIDSR
jgi:hypothetical protein